MESNSSKQKLNAIDFGKIFTGLIIALIGSFLTYMTVVITGIEWGIWTAIVMPIWSMIVNAIRKWMIDYSK